MNNVILFYMKPVNRELSHRQRQALQTQQLIVEAAKLLFLEQGYGATTISAIAKRAGVAVSTVYAIYTNKRGILKAVRESWHQASGVRDLYQIANKETDPERRLELYAYATRRQWEEGTDMIAIYKGAASVDEEAASELQNALEGRRKSISAWLESSISLFRQDLKPEYILATYLALTQVELYQELVNTWGWTADDYEAWLARTLKQQFLETVS